MAFTNIKRIKLFEKIKFISLCLVAVIMPFGIYLTKLAIALWFATWLLQLDISKFKIKLGKYEKIILFAIIIFFILDIIGYFYSADKHYALKIIEKKLYLLFFPIVFITANSLYRKYYKFVLSSFVAGTIFASAISLVVAFAKSISFENNKLIFQATDMQGGSFFESIGYGGNHFFYGNFSIFHHPSYASILVIFSIVILFFLTRQTEIQKKDLLTKILSKKIIAIAIIIYLIIITFLLTSKANIITLLVLFFIVFIFSEIRFKFYYLGLIFLLSIAFTSRNPRFTIYSNYLSTKKENNNNILETKTGTARLYIWKSAYEIFKKNAVFGVGTGDTESELTKEYKKEHFNKLEKRKFNAHNEFVETILRLGIVGMTFFLFIFLSGAYLAFKNRNYFLLFFFVISAINFFFESMLNRVAGVIFWSFFLNFLLFIKPVGKSNNIQNKNLFINKLKKLHSFWLFIIPLLFYIVLIAIDKSVLSQDEIIATSWFKIKNVFSFQNSELPNITEIITGTWLNICKIPNVYWVKLLAGIVLSAINTVFYKILIILVPKYKKLIFTIILVISLLLGIYYSFYFNNYNFVLLFFLISILFFIKYLKVIRKRSFLFISIIFLTLSVIIFLEKKHTSKQFDIKAEQIYEFIDKNKDIFLKSNFKTDIPILPYLTNKPATIINNNNADFELNTDSTDYFILSSRELNKNLIQKLEKNYKFAYSNDELFVYRNYNTNLWTKKTSWNLPKDSENEPLGFNIYTKEHGIYTMSAKIKYFANDSSLYSRITIIAEYEDKTKDIKVINEIKKDEIERYYELSLKTDNSKELKRIYGWFLDHSKVNGKKHVSIRNIKINVK